MTVELQKPVDPKPERKKPLSLDEVMETVSNIAKDPDNRDQFKALKMLASAQSAATVLPDPLGERELVQRLARLMKAAGIDLCHVAYAHAFRTARGVISDAPTIHLGHVSEIIAGKLKKIRNLKALYKAFPEIKRPGVPPGYPMAKGAIVQQAWIQKTAAKMFLDQEQSKADARSEAQNAPPSKNWASRENPAPPKPELEQPEA